MQTPTPPPIQVRDLRKSFRGRNRVNNVSFDVPAGTVLGLLGPNGAGKTTTLRAMLELISRDGGDTLFFGVPYSALQNPAQKIGVVLDAGGLHPARTGRQHLTIAAARAGVSSSRVDVVLREVGMTSDADRRAGGYSLGMRQRIAIAASILGEPQLLIMDEPSNGLDPTGMRWLREMLRAFAAAGGTVVLSSHLLSDIQEIADRVVVVDEGRVVAQARMDDVLADPAGTLEDYYLGVTTSREVR